MFVTLATHNRTLRILAGESRRRQEAEAKLVEKDTAILRLQSLVEHHRDEHPDAPVVVQPATGEARLVQQLALSERARKQLDQQCLTLHWANLQQEHELCQLREQLAEVQAAAEEVAS
jgi:hypothetical protein